MTYANLLTILRMAMVPFFVILIANDRPKSALAVFVVAGFTDILDGYIARNFGQNSSLGEILDPIADKLLLVTSFLALTLQRDVFDLRIPLWLTITVISRDLILLISGLVIRLTVGARRFPPTWLGKRTTFFQLSTIFLVLAASVVPSLYAMRLAELFQVVTWVTLALTVASGLDYCVRGFRVISE